MKALPPGLGPGGPVGLWLRLLLCLGGLCPASAGPDVLPERAILEITETWGVAIADEIIYCNSQMPTCDMTAFATEFGRASWRMRRQIDTKPPGVPHFQPDCDRFWTAVDTAMSDLRTTCASEWSAGCGAMQAEIRQKRSSPDFDIPVICGIVSPGTSAVRLPHCSSLVRASNHQSSALGSCADWNQTYCVEQFCTMYEMFQWRMRPANLMGDEVEPRFRFPSTFVLPGCEDFEPFNFTTSKCSDREDVNGYCSCICPKFPLVATYEAPPVKDCPAEVEDFLLFGRMGVKESYLSKDCEGPVCNLFTEASTRWQCDGLHLPSQSECVGLKMPQVPVGCPWETDSGTNGILECLDGHRCNVTEDGWECCSPLHLGRGRCPADAPVMCDSLCSGDTEYCCRSYGQCAPRPCSPLLLKEARLIYYPVTRTSTLPPPAELVLEEGGNPIAQWLYFALGPSWKMWLAMICVTMALCCCFTGVIYFSRYAAIFLTVEEDGGKLQMEAEIDKLGGFNIVRPLEKRWEDDAPKVSLHRIMVGELPMNRPLGLELMETKVVRVHPAGRKWGWQVGDVIVDISGTPVATFEEIWNRIQIERDRLPVRFTVERYGAEGADIEALDEHDRAAARRKGGSKVAPVVPMTLEGMTKSQSAVARAQSKLNERGDVRPAWAWPDKSDTLDPAVTQAPATGSFGSALPGFTEAFQRAQMEADRPDTRASGSSGDTSDEPPRIPRPKYNGPKFEEAFPVMDKTGFMQSLKQPTRKKAVWVTDAWGRAVVKSTV